MKIAMGCDPNAAEMKLHMTASWTYYAGEDNSTVIYGTKGEMRIYDEPGYSITVSLKNGEKALYQVDQIQTNEHQTKSGIIDAFVQAVTQNEEPKITGESVLSAMYLSEHTLSAARFQIHQKAEQQRFLQYQSLLGIKAQGSDGAITALSGGNQQKVFLARWLNTQAELLLLDNPTQGIDVGAKAEIYRLIFELAGEGKTILINTLEIPEIQKVADVCAVFYNGRIIQMLSHGQIDEHTVMIY